MVEVIFTWHGTYPFRGPKQSENTFMQVVKHDLTDDQITFERQKGKIIKKITSPHFIKLIKTLKEDAKLHFVYEYEQVPLEEYIKNLKKSIEGTVSRDKYNFLILDFKNNIDNMLDVLIKLEIKADVVICNIAVHSVNQQDGSLLLKTFLDPEAQYLSLIDHDYRAKDSKKKDKSSINQEYLSEFYEAERKRLMLDFQQLLQKTFEKFCQNVEKKQFPNFVINGTKLVFMNCDQKERENFTENQGKNNKHSERSKNQNQIGENKQRHQLKTEQLKKPQHQKSINSAPSLTIRRQPQFQKPKDKRPQSPIIDFDQSFEPQFRPQEFLKEKTYIYEERDYLESLEQELHNMQGEKQGIEVPKKKQEEKKIIKETPHSKKQQYASEKTLKVRPPKELSVSQGSTQGHTYHNNLNQSNASNTNMSQNDSYDKKDQKMNKYKMKIITSHQIEVEGSVEQPNVQEIQKQIIEGIKSGKINIKELAAQKNPKVTVVSRNQSLEGSQNSSGMYQSDHRDENKSTQYLSNIQKSNKSEKIRHDPEGQSKPSIKTREIHMSKMKNISQILEKIGVRSNNGSQYSNSQHSETNHSLVANNKVESKKSAQHAPTIHTASTQQNRTEKTEKSQREDSSRDHSDEKNAKTENYINKIKEAKSKAQQILKEYTKKKQ